MLSEEELFLLCLILWCLGALGTWLENVWYVVVTHRRYDAWSMIKLSTIFPIASAVVGPPWILYKCFRWWKDAPRRTA